jgi:putative sporulation protein YyaC
VNLYTTINEPQKIKAHIDDINETSRLESSLHKSFISARPRPILILCIGTDRSTGDSLGPLIGTLLTRFHLPDLQVLGTLDYPVHAANLREIIAQINSDYRNPFILAIDACLGRLDSIGCITLAKGPLRPGAGVNKNLPPVGEIHITGIVNVGGFMEYMVLQNTRLNLVWRMSETIAALIMRAYLSAYSCL